MGGLLSAGMFCTVGSFSLAGYPVCAAACMEAAAAICTASAALTGPGAAACAAAGAGTCLAGCACFDVGTYLQTPTGLRPISEVAEGDFVTTLVNGKAVKNKVTSVFKVNRSFDFSMLETSTGSLNVTTQHPVHVQQDGKILKQMASSISVGDILLGLNGSVETSSSVTSIEKVRKESKFVLETELGSVVAGGILVGTPSKNEISQYPRESIV